MKIVKFICLYCNYQWSREFYYLPKNATCLICNDKNVKIKLPDDKVNYYNESEKDDE